jgi:hypothetical protein
MKTEDLFSRTDRHSHVLELTPALAEDLLTHCNTHNRTLMDAHVETLANEMRAGRWQLTHQGIAFSPNRVLLDGQHRLWAVVMSGVTVPMRIFVNEPPEAMAVIDTGKTRSNDQILSLSANIGHVGRDELATLRAMIAGLGTARRRSAGDELTWLLQHREAITFASELLSGKRQFRGIATCITKAVLARAWYSCDRAMLRHFADVLQRGAPVGENDQPVVLLFQFLIGSSSGGKVARLELRERYAKTERALAAFLKGERLHRLFATPEELFPLPDEK